MGQSISICRYWCSTKVDDELEHIGGQGNWGFCRPSCPPITPVTSTTTTQRPRPTTRSSTHRLRLDKGHFHHANIDQISNSKWYFVTKIVLTCSSDREKLKNLIKQ